MLSVLLKTFLWLILKWLKRYEFYAIFQANATGHVDFDAASEYVLKSIGGLTAVKAAAETAFDPCQEFVEGAIHERNNRFKF
jgi:hypothetical protein